MNLTKKSVLFHFLFFLTIFSVICFSSKMFSMIKKLEYLKQKNQLCSNGVEVLGVLKNLEEITNNIKKNNDSLHKLNRDKKYFSIGLVGALLLGFFGGIWLSSRKKLTGNYAIGFAVFSMTAWSFLRLYIKQKDEKREECIEKLDDQTKKIDTEIGDLKGFMLCEKNDGLVCISNHKDFERFIGLAYLLNFHLDNAENNMGPISDRPLSRMLKQLNNSETKSGP